jgi:general secretion pathway protein L
MSAAADHEPKHLLSLARSAMRWWLGELAGLARDGAALLPWPERNSASIEAGERYWVVRTRERVLGQVDCATDPENAAAMLRRLTPGLARATIELPPERVLARRVELPAVSQADLARILRFEITRHFPFPAERALFAHRVLPRRAASPGHVAVEIVAVARETTVEIRALLAAAGIEAARIVVADASGASLVLTENATPRPRSVMALAAALGMATLAAIASPVVHERMELATLNREIAALAPKANALGAAHAKERRAVAQVAGPLALAAARPPLVALLDALTKSVPDGAWLQSLSISGQEVTIDGLSPSAAAVALQLEKSGAFTHVAFRAPIARDPATGLEHFALGATVAGGK